MGTIQLSWYHEMSGTASFGVQFALCWFCTSAEHGCKLSQKPDTDGGDNAAKDAEKS